MRYNTQGCEIEITKKVNEKESSPLSPETNQQTKTVYRPIWLAEYKIIINYYFEYQILDLIKYNIIF